MGKAHSLVTQQKVCDRQKADRTYIRVIIGLLAVSMVAPLVSLMVGRVTICACAEP